MPRKAHGRRGLSTWLTDSGTPVFVLDARRMVLVFNRGCEELTGWAAADVVGTVCDFATESDRTQVESVTGALCPPPEVLEGQSQSVDVALPGAGGTSLGRRVHFFPLGAADDPKLRILGVITERESAGTHVRSSTDLHRLLAEEAFRIRSEHDVDSLIATGPEMERVLAQTRLARASSASVHLAGERGVGKQHVARMIHYGSEYRLRSFVPLDCSALPAFDMKRTVRRLLESARMGEASEVALCPGAVFLNQVGDLPRDVQELLVAESGHRGSDPPVVRLFSAETRPLEQLVESEALLTEFVCMLTQLTIHVPALRQRVGELPLIAQQLLEDLNRDQERQVAGFAPDVLEAFQGYQWPGNVVELKSVIDEARAAATSSTIQPQDLPYWFRVGVDAQSLGPAPDPRPRPLAAHLAEVEAEQIRWALSAARHNRSQAAELLGLTRAKLYRRMEALGIADRES